MAGLRDELHDVSFGDHPRARSQQLAVAVQCSHAWAKVANTLDCDWEYIWVCMRKCLWGRGVVGLLVAIAQRTIYWHSPRNSIQQKTES